MEGRVARIDADVIARSSFSLRDARDESLHTEVEASDANCLSLQDHAVVLQTAFALRLQQECTSCFCFRIRQKNQTCSPLENWDHANIQVDEQDMLSPVFDSYLKMRLKRCRVRRIRIGESFKHKIMNPLSCKKCSVPPAKSIYSVFDRFKDINQIMENFNFCVLNGGRSSNFDKSHSDTFFRSYKYFNHL